MDQYWDLQQISLLTSQSVLCIPTVYFRQCHDTISWRQLHWLRSFVRNTVLFTRENLHWLHLLTSSGNPQLQLVVRCVILCCMEAGTRDEKNMFFWTVFFFAVLKQFFFGGHYCVNNQHLFWPFKYDWRNKLSYGWVFNVLKWFRT